MRRYLVFLICPLMCLSLQGILWAQQTVVPAGTLLRCTLNEPNFSSATAAAGDPFVCHADAVQQFGREAFPRGTYLAGHLESFKDPGHFVGKGWLKLEFDRIGLPNTEVPVPGKIIAVRGYRVDRQGNIRGHGHASRDMAEWMLPPLWPWKVMTLPARGPRPELKGEVQVTMRLMEDVIVPNPTATVPRVGSQPTAEAFSVAKNPSLSVPSIRYVPPNVPVWQNRVSGGLLNASKPAAESEPTGGAEPNLTRVRRPTAVTLIALKSSTIYGATDYWLDSGRLSYILPTGIEQSVDLGDVDWKNTFELNSQRNVEVTLRTGRRRE
jgi:hypothetical protein